MRRSGLTLLEILVLLGIGAFVLAIGLMLLPRMNESARRDQCAERERKLGLAVLKQVELKGQFPGFRQTLKSVDRCVSWPVLLLPGIGETKLYEDWNAPPPPPARFLPQLLCPSNPAATFEAPMLSYIANAGRADREKLTDGIFFDHCSSDPLVMTADFLQAHDGAERTLMLSERRDVADWTQLSPTRVQVGFLWYPLAEADTATARAARPSSFHPGGFNVIFCDGHGEFLTNDIDPRVYIQLMSPDTEIAQAGQ